MIEDDDVFSVIKQRLVDVNEANVTYIGKMFDAGCLGNKDLEAAIDFIPKLALKMVMGDRPNPLELIGWYVIDSLAKNQTGVGIKKLIEDPEYNLSKDIENPKQDDQTA